MRNTTQIMAINGIENTPLLPSYYRNTPYSVSNYGTNKKVSKFGITHARQIAKTLNLKTTYSGKNIPIGRLVGKISNSIKQKPNLNKVSDLISKLAAKLKIPRTKAGKKIPIGKLWDSMVKSIKQVTPTGKPIGSGINGKKHTGRNRQSQKQAFGSWWDNTQRNYCLGTQCAQADQLGSGYPYHGDWKPYASISGPSFGRYDTINRYRKSEPRKSERNLSLPYDRNSVIMDIPHRQPYFPSVYDKWGGFPSAVSSPYPFVNN